MVVALRKRLSAADGARASFRELATSAGVSVPTLRHYFGGREGAIEAVLKAAHQVGKHFMRQAIEAPLRPLSEGLRGFAEFVTQGFAVGLADLHSLGLAAGLRDPALGPAYVNETLEPTLQCLETILHRYRDRGDLRADCDVRHAAIAFISPLFVSLLHQGPLGGRSCRPLDVPEFIRAHVEGFVGGYRAR